METVSEDKTVYVVSSGRGTIRAPRSQMRNADIVETGLCRSDSVVVWYSVT
jgi:hypothetical protein